MSLDLKEENFIDFKIKDEEENVEEEEHNEIHPKSKTVADKPIQNIINEESIVNTNKNAEKENVSPFVPKNKKNKNSLKIPI
jgi:hypothetical protein